MKLEVTFRSGVQITVPVAGYSFERGPLGRELLWTAPDDADRRLVYLDAGEAVAVVEIREPQDTDTAPAGDAAEADRPST